MPKNQTVEMDGKILVEDTVIRSLYAKTEMCKLEPMSDIPSLMVIAVESNESNPEHDSCVEFQKEHGLSKPYHMALIPLIHRDDVVECIEDLVKAIPPAKFDFVILAVEGFIQAIDKDKLAKTETKRGDLQKEFMENPFTNVMESLIVTAMDWNTSVMFNTSTVFKYDDFGVPQFNETDCVTVDIEDEGELPEMGRIPETLANFIKFMNLAVVADTMSNLMSDGRKPKES
jgi:hypothetical protein